MIIDTFHSTTCIVSYQLDISRSYYFVWYGWYLHVMSCLISVQVWRMSLTWKIEPYFGMVLLSVGQHQSLWPAIKTSFQTVRNCTPNWHQIQWCKSSFSLFGFSWFSWRTFAFFIRYLMDISKYSQNATRQYQTLFFFIVNHHIQWYTSRYAVK